MKNKYEIRGDITVIYLTNRKGETYETLIDTEDLERVKESNLSWHLEWDKKVGKYYCKATKYIGIIDGKPKYQTVRLHKFIVNFQGQHVDHLNHNTLDNRKGNLKEKTAQGNLVNREGANSNSTTGYRNVSYSRAEQKYIVQLQVNGKNKKLGSFTDVHEAGKFAEEMRNKYYPKVNNQI